MKKVLKRSFALMLVMALLLPLIGCNASNFNKALDANEIEYTFSQSETYHNGQAIEGQWGANQDTSGGEYGIGDPFVMRYDGKYYLYPSSGHPENGVAGIKVFSSEDLVNWTYEGFAVEGEEANFAYAPEVVYYNGTFYLCESAGGNGHYIYKSNSPVGPFERVTDNFGRVIDGAFWIGDDGQLYFLYPDNNVMQIAPIDMQTMLPGIETSLAGTLNGWTEGPGMFRRGDMLYLTYTGNTVTSDSYRVGSVVECHLAKVDVASPNLVYRSISAPWPSGKAKLCKSFTLQFESGWRLHFITVMVMQETTCWVVFLLYRGFRVTIDP